MSVNVEEMRRDRNRAVDAKRRKRNALAALRGEPVGLIDAAPIRARTLTLVELGWSFEAILHASGCTGTAAGLRLVANGTSRRVERKWLPILNMVPTLKVPDSVPDTCFVPTLGATRRVRALMALGWRHDDITEFIGRASHHFAATTYPRVTAIDWRIVDAAYEQMSTARGGSVKTETRARKAGFAPPMAWTDIDDPHETPRDWEYIAPDRADHLRDLADLGHGITEVCTRLHTSRTTLEKWCERHGMRDTYNLLLSRETPVIEGQKRWAS